MKNRRIEIAADNALFFIDISEVAMWVTINSHTIPGGSCPLDITLKSGHTIKLSISAEAIDGLVKELRKIWAA